MEMIDSALADFKITEAESRKTERPFTIWVDESVKEKYDVLQAVSKKKFCAIIKALSEQAINKAAEKAGIDVDQAS